MKRLLIGLFVLAWLATPASAAGLLRERGSATPLAIDEHHVRVVLEGGFAITEVEQTFVNGGDRTLEAVYTFPLPRRAALSELWLEIDGVAQIGEVVEAEKARAVYEAERDAGRQAALARTRDYHAFDVTVAAVPPGGEVRLRLVYLQPVEIDGGVLRYVYPLEEGGIDADAQAFWDLRQTVESSFRFEALVRNPYPIDALRLPDHPQAVIRQVAGDTWSVVLDAAESPAPARLDRDLVLYARLAEDEPARIDLTTHREPGAPGTFLMTVTPGMDLAPTDAGVDWTFVVDVSGSMEAKLATVSDGLVRALGELREEDRFRIVSFAETATRLHGGWLDATPENLRRGRELVRSLVVRGGTNVHAGLSLGLQDLEADRPSALILVSDGGANVGPTALTDFLALLETRDVRVFSFAIGSGAHLALLEAIAEESGAFAMTLSNADDLYGRLVQARSKLSHEALHGVEIEIDGVPVSERAPRRLRAAYRGEQILLFGRYDAPGRARVTLRGRISGVERSWSTELDFPERSTATPELERLWAFARIGEVLLDHARGLGDDDVRGQVVPLALEHSLVTPYTSMIVVREERYDELGIERRNLERARQERDARAARETRPVQATRADAAAPMFRGARAPRHGGGGASGSGAAGPFVVGLGLALLGLDGLRRRRARRR